jgi:hypothetical protein
MSGISSFNRVYLQVGPGAAGLYLNGPASVLKQHSGILFPFQPDISYQQSVNYSPYDLVHTNYNFNAYRNTPSPGIQIQAQFSNATFEEHAYTQGVIHFLRCVTKMFYGIGDGDLAGTPPPVLRLSGFGEFKSTRVILNSWSKQTPSNIDLIEYDAGFGPVALPVIQTMMLDLVVQQSPDRQKNNYSTSGLISGNLYSEGFI